MSISRKSTSAALALTVALPALMAATSAQADDHRVTRAPTQIGATQMSTIPPAFTPTIAGGAMTIMTAPASVEDGVKIEKYVDENGVETIVRTRYINPPAPGIQPNTGMPVQPMTPYPVVFERDQWLDECERRTSGRSEREKGGIIGGLLGGVAGGVAGNLIAGAGDKLAGTLIGAGTGGLAGVLLGSLIGGGKKRGKYDCEAALDGYISQYGQPGSARTIAYPYPPSGYHYMHTGQYNYAASCGCQYPQMALVPIRTEVRQRLIKRETSTIIEVPGERVIDPRVPTKLVPIKTAPRPAKLIKQ